MDEKMRKRSLANPRGICEYCGNPVDYQSRFCSNCGKENTGWIEEYGESQCGNCQAYLEPGDKYCRICGTKAGEGAFDPYQNLMECIYGPEPVEREHVCKRCGYRWVTCMMLDRENYCPKCGGPAPHKDSEGRSRRGIFGFLR